MATNIQYERQQAHQLLDVLPEDKVSAVRNLLEVMVEPLSSSLAAAPFEDEELNTDTVESLDKARASIARGDGISHDEILREFSQGMNRLDRLESRSTGRRKLGLIFAPSTVY